MFAYAGPPHYTPPTPPFITSCAIGPQSNTNVSVPIATSSPQTKRRRFV
jgi:hypothetical protein